MEIAVLITKIESVYLNWGYPLIFVSSFIETTPLGWMIPGGTIVALGGYFSFNSGLSLVGVILSGGLGMFATFLLSYALGKNTGERLAKRLNQQQNANKAKRLLQNYGAVILTTSLMANLTRFWVAYISGTQKYSLPKFIFYSITASLTWNSLLAVIGYMAGSERERIEKGLTYLGFLSWILFILVIALILYFSKKEFKNE